MREAPPASCSRRTVTGSFKHAPRMGSPAGAITSTLMTAKCCHFPHARGRSTSPASFLLPIPWKQTFFLTRGLVHSPAIWDLTAPGGRRPSAHRRGGAACAAPGFRKLDRIDDRAHADWPPAPRTASARCFDGPRRGSPRSLAALEGRYDARVTNLSRPMRRDW